MQSVYVIADTPLEAELYSLELYNMTLDEGKEYVKDLDIAVMWCYLDDVDLVCESTDNFDNY